MSLPYASLPRATRRAKAEILTRELLTQWDLAEIPLTLITDGFNTTFRGEGPEGPLVVRLHRRDLRPLSAFEVECRWTEVLRAQGLDVPEVVRTRTGAHVALLDSHDPTQPIALSVFRWREGQILWNAGLREPELQKHLVQVGELIGALHLQSASDRSLEDLCPDHRQWYGIIPECLDVESLSPSLQALYQAAKQEAEAVFARDSSRPLQLCHADFHGGNILLRADGAVGLLDFDDCLLATRTCDLGISCFYLLDRGDDEKGPARLTPRASARIHALRQGYERHVAWPLEDADLRGFIMARQLVLLNMLSQDRSPERQPFFENYKAHTEDTLRGFLSPTEDTQSPEA